VTQVNKEAGEMFHYYPHVSAGGKRFSTLSATLKRRRWAFTSARSMASPARRQPESFRRSLRTEYDAGSGRLLYLQGAGVLRAQRLELDPPRLTGDPAMVAKGVRFDFSNGYAEFSVSRNGTLFYGQGSGGERCGTDGGIGRASF
jgi:hypothetical protein